MSSPTITAAVNSSVSLPLRLASLLNSSRIICKTLNEPRHETTVLGVSGQARHLPGCTVTWADLQTNPVSGKACSPTKGGLICLYMQPLLAPQTTEFAICISIYIRLHAVTLLPPPRSLVPRLGLGITWVRQLRSGSCHYPTAATKCNVGRPANKPRQWKSMLTHQGWFNLLIYATITRTTNYRVCNLHIYLYPTPRRHSTTTEEGLRLEISDLGSRGIVLHVSV